MPRRTNRPPGNLRNRPRVLEYDEVIWGHIDILVVAELESIEEVEGENSTSGPHPYQPYPGGDYHLPYFQQNAGVV